MIENALWMLILSALTVWLGLLIIKKQPNRMWLIILVEVALVLRFIFVYIMYASGTEVSGTDGLVYHQIAKDVAVQLSKGVSIFEVKYEYTWYTVLMGIQYFIFGVNRCAASFINAFITAISGLFLTGIALNLNFSFKKSSVIGLAYLFMPSMFAWTTDTRKEALSFFFAILIWYLTLRVLKERDWSQKKKTVYIVLVCLLLWLSTLLRIYMLFTIGGGLLVGFLFQYIKTKRRLIAFFGVAILITCILVTFTTVMTNMRDYHALNMDRNEKQDDDLDEEVGSIINTILGKDIPGSINSFLAKPYPENVPSITDISGNNLAITIVRIEMILWYICMILAVFGFLDTLLKWDPYLLGIIAFIVSYSLINALISENVQETYYRYRAAIVAPVLLFADFRPLVKTIKSILLRT